MMNRPFIMVASVGSKEDASSNNTNHLDEWTKVTSRKFVKRSGSSKPVRRGISNFKLNQNAMRVFVGSADNTNITRKIEKNEPHKPHREEAFRKIPDKKRLIRGFCQVMTKTFSNKKFEKIITRD
jgi:hypothetical protein